MNILQRYFFVSILQAVAFALAALLGLQAFMDLTGELPAVGKNGYGMQHAALYVLTMLPQHVNEVLPVASLIGTIYTMAQFASTSEFTIMRASSMTTRMAATMVGKVGAVLVVLAFLFGELITPYLAPLSEKIRLTGRGTTVSSEFRSGMWTKDIVKSAGMTGDVQGTRFFNVREVRPDGELADVKLYDFDTGFRLRSLTLAKTATFKGNNTWQLNDVTENVFSNPALAVEGAQANLANNFAQATSVVEVRKHASKELISEITPKILSVSGSDPERMSANELAVYTRHLQENKQGTERFKIAFWKKMFDPLAIFVLMALALPFAYLHTRSGGVSLKIFIGIMIGVSFLLVNTLFSHIGLLSALPAFLTALMPSLLYLALALGALYWVERH
ncbi:LPS export ABC transporter permease LptG [Pseudoduganella violaceinigra]|uniref:LPS export ABC transporter permease LptG n=1 Tax=Pseudoduganella violaceinigra TaxID=246602 RepID=UPI000403A8CD|nr:LPS export ABC transporter permease LptG [Pseudoduganella violaceinigra]